MFKRFLKRIDERCSIYTMAKVIGILLIIFLLMTTYSAWGAWISLLKAILQPFLIGFGLAYIMYPLVSFLEQKGIPKNFSIIALWVCIIVFLVVLLVLLAPALYDKLNSFISSLIDGVNWISNKIVEAGQLSSDTIVASIKDYIIQLLQKSDDWLPNLVATLPGFMNVFLNVLTNVIFSIIIAIYMLFDFPKIKSGIKHFLKIFFKNPDQYLTEIDDNVTVYLKSLVIIILIKFFEYSAFYFLIGHRDWLIIGMLTSMGVLVPYLGGTIANGIGIVTALSLPPSNVAALIIGILILSNVDAYVISPLVHEKRSSLGPLITLFAVFAGGVLLGAIGIMLSVPVTIIIKTLVDVYKENHLHEEEVIS